MKTVFISLLEPPKDKLEHLSIEKDRKHIEKIKNHITTLVKKYDQQINCEVMSSTTPNTLVAKISLCEKNMHEKSYSLTQLKNGKYDRNPYVRTYISSWKNDDQIELGQDIHLFIGDESVTQAAEIEDAIMRLENYIEKIEQEYDVEDLSVFFDAEFLHTANFLRNHTLEVVMKENHITFFFRISEDYSRKQIVDVNIEGKYVVFSSNALNLNDIDCNNCLTDKGMFIIKYTLERNARMDFVDFYLDGDYIKGRIVFPIQNLQKEEFMYYAYILACETDRLENIVNDFAKGDRY
jgi:hypothetical protein